MDICKRIENLEKLVNELIEKINKSQFYTNADIEGVRKNITEMDSKIYPAWCPNKCDYFAGERVSYGEKYYRSIQAHTSQADWAPDVAVSLWAEITDPAEEWPEWKQPAGAHDSYSKGDKVSHIDKHWISGIDDNAYEPGVYGWVEA